MDRTQTYNPCFVGVAGEQIVVTMPKQRMSKEDALMHAAWLVALADPEGDKFPEYLEAVINT